MPAAVAIPLISAAIAGGGAIAGSAIGAHASGKAADQQTVQQEKALDFQKQEYADQKANQAPFVEAGQNSIGQLMKLFADGKLGPGSIPDFKAPTLAEAQQTPGYQFTQQEGEKGIQRGAAAAGGAFTGGTLKDLARYDTGLADSTYQQLFSNAFSGYQALLASQNQGFNQLSAVAGLGENAAANAGNAGAQASNTIGSTLTNIGATQAAGTIGKANSIVSGIDGLSSALQTPFYLRQLKQNSINNPMNIQNSANAGNASIDSMGLPTGGLGYTFDEIPRPDWPDYAGAG